MKLPVFLIVFYPLIIPLWHSAPLTDKKIFASESPAFVDTEKVDFLAASYSKLKDNSIKSSIILTLAASNNQKAADHLIQMLRIEKNKRLQADIIKALYSLRKIKIVGKNEFYETMLEDNNKIIRACSSALYLNSGGDPDRLLSALIKENSLYVLKVAEKEIVQEADKCSPASLRKILSSDNPDRRRLAVRIAAARKGNPDNFSPLQAVAHDTNISVRAALAETLAGRQNGGTKLLNILSNDESSTVRGYTAASVPLSERLPLYIKLTADTDREVRRAAALSLGSFSDKTAINALLKLFADPAPEVRKTAENAVIRINPGKTVPKYITEKLLPVPASRLAALKVLGLLRYKEAAGEIEKLLKQKKGDATIIRSIRALGRLDYKPAAELIASKAKNSNPEIRRATAYALGKLGVRETFDTIILLSRDQKDISTAIEAVEAMGRIADPFFNNRLSECINDVKASPELRSYACWSIAEIGKPTQKMLKQMEKLLLKAVIPADGGKVVDSDAVRISALLAFIDIGKKQPALIKKAQEAIAKINPAPDKLIFAVEADRLLKEYARQAELYMQGESVIKPAPVPAPSIPVTVQRLNKKK